jgi:hypothetical protein
MFMGGKFTVGYLTVRVTRLFMSLLSRSISLHGSNLQLVPENVNIVTPPISLCCGDFSVFIGTLFWISRVGNETGIISLLHRNHTLLIVFSLVRHRLPRRQPGSDPRSIIPYPSRAGPEEQPAAGQAVEKHAVQLDILVLNNPLNLETG